MPNNLIGRRIRQHREHQRREIAEFAQTVDIDVARLGAIEEGLERLSFDEFVRIQEALCVCHDDLTDPFRLVADELDRVRVTLRAFRPYWGQRVGTHRCLPLRMGRRLGWRWRSSDPRVVARERRMMSHRRG